MDRNTLPAPERDDWTAYHAEDPGTWPDPSLRVCEVTVRESDGSRSVVLTRDFDHEGHVALRWIAMRTSRPLRGVIAWAPYVRSAPWKG